jgi:hypothetical protein
LRSYELLYDEARYIAPHLKIDALWIQEEKQWEDSTEK